MNRHLLSTVPSLYVQSQGDMSLKVALSLTRAARRVVVRFTGGCGYMSPEDGRNLIDLIAPAFQGFEGAILFGGTRMLRRDDPSIVHPGITEIPPVIRQQCSRSVVLGVVPRTSDLGISDHGMLVADSPEDDYFTIVHPDQDVCLVVQISADDCVCWEAEFWECLKITKYLKTFAWWSSLLLSYNGGSVTEKEILAVADEGWPVLLIAGSGRKTDEYAENEAFLESHPHVCVAEKSTVSIREKLMQLGVLSQEGERNCAPITYPKFGRAG